MEMLFGIWSQLWTSFDWVTLGQILGVNIVLSGDNAVLIALAAAGLPAETRARAIMFGMVLAVILRVALSLAAVWLLAVPGLLFIGGAMLLWIARSFYLELRHKDAERENPEEMAVEEKTMSQALRQIVIADVSMSLDNVLAVAGAASGNMPMLVVGLVISILLMGVAASLISRLLDRYTWIAYVGVALIVWIGAKMVYEDLVHFYHWMNHAPAHAGTFLERPNPPGLAAIQIAERAG